MLAARPTGISASFSLPLACVVFVVWILIKQCAGPLREEHHSSTLTDESFFVE